MAVLKFKAVAPTHWFSFALTSGPWSPPSRHLTAFGDVSDRHSWSRGAPGVCWVQARDAAPQSQIHRTAPPPKQQQIIGPRCQLCQAEKTWFKDRGKPKRKCILKCQFPHDRMYCLTTQNTASA